jgi:thiol-disulfide isomerase/thioredoxin
MRARWLLALFASVVMSHQANSAELPVEGQMPSLRPADAWLNSKPLSNSDLRGKVVLIDFWTYTCINWRRTLAYLRAWAERYRDEGLVIVGVHTPEFSFEKDIENVRRAVREQNIGYPVALDSDYALWNAFKNQYWPAVYLIDARGRVRHYQIGEGDYDQLELVIRQLLAEAGHGDSDRSPTPVQAGGAELAADWKNIGTPETYLGSARGSRPAATLSGEWKIGRESAVLVKANGRVSYRFRARDLHLVMGPATRGEPVRFRVRVDGQAPGESHGVDIDAEGQGTLDMPRMYQLIRQAAPIRERLFEIEFLNAGAEVFVFTFG